MSNQIEKIGSNLRFAPSLKLSIITIILLSILVYLGLWQMDRAAYKKNIFTISQKKLLNPEVDLKSLSNPSLGDDQFTPVSFDGVFLDRYTFLIDNQMLNHKVGFRVITAVQAPSLSKWVLVDRGWVPANKERANLPALTSIYGVKHISGLINTISTGILLSKDKPNLNGSWPMVIQAVDYEFIAQELKHPIFNFIVQPQTNDISDYTMPPIELGISSNKHVGYAIQWFALAILLFAYYIVVSIKREL